jgi:cytochrome P450
MRAFSYNAICGFVAGADKKHEDTLVAMAQDFTKVTSGLGDLLIPEWYADGGFAQGLRARERVLEIIKCIIQERQAKLSSGDVAEYWDALGHLMGAKDEESGEGLSVEQLCDNTINLLFAGYDTTSATLSSIFDILLNEIPKDELEILKQEICESDLDLENPGAVDVLLKLPVLDAFTKEALRLAAPIPAVMRVATQDVIMEPEGYLIKKGSIVSLGLSPTMEMEDRWSFKMKRFLSEEQIQGGEELDKKFPSSFYPFGVGSRLCLGMHLARLEVSVWLLKSYQRRIL